MLHKTHDGHFFAFPLLTLAPAPPTKLDGRNFPDALATNCAMQPRAAMHNVYIVRSTYYVLRTGYSPVAL